LQRTSNPLEVQMSISRHAPLRHAFLAAGLTLSLAACGNDDSNGAPFNAQGTSSDMNAVAAAFSSPTMASLAWSSGSMDAVFGAPLVRSSLGAIQTAAPASTSLAASGRRLVQSAMAFNGRATPNVALAVLPVEALGKTLEYNPATAVYEVTARIGAPANGVRFILYTINPVTRVPVEPLTEAGYADVLDESTATANSVRLQLVSGGVTYLDYGITGSTTATSGSAVIDGFATDGTTRVNFVLDNSYAGVINGAASSATLDYRLDAPSLDVSLHYVVSLTQLQVSEIAAVDITVAGPHGNVGIKGQVAETGGALTATVNGDAFAVVTIDGEGTVASITKPDGSALTAEEYGALAAIWGLVKEGADVFEDLLDPVDNLL
jgi:hypothetical protein